MSGVTVATMIASISLGVDAALRETLLRGFGGKIAGGDTLLHDVTLADAGALHDPLVVGIHHLFEVGVRQQLRRNVYTQRTDLGPDRLTRRNLQIQSLTSYLRGS